MKKRIIELAEKSLDFQLDLSLCSIYLLKYLEYLIPYYSFLYLVSREFKPKMMVEIGTYWGIGAIHLALGNPEGKVITIDKMDWFQETIHKFCQNENIMNIKAIVGESAKMASSFADNSIDLLFIDGDHEYIAEKEDYIKYFPKVKDNGIILIDDIQQTKEMERFWEEVKDCKFDINFIRQANSIRPEQGVGFGVVLKGGFDEG